MTQAGVDFVSGLGGAADVQILDDVRAAVQNQHHLAFELGGQNRFHRVVPRRCLVIPAATKASESKLGREPCGASTTSEVRSRAASRPTL